MGEGILGIGDMQFLMWVEIELYRKIPHLLTGMFSIKKKSVKHGGQLIRSSFSVVGRHFQIHVSVF